MIDAVTKKEESGASVSEESPAAPPRRLRIAYVVHDYNRHAGHSRYVAELACRFRRDHEVHIYANTFEEPDPHGLIFHHVPALRMNAMASMLTFILPATFWVRGQFDIIHAQGLCGLRQNVVTAHICQGAWHDAMVEHTGRPGWRKRLFQALALGLEKYTYRQGGTRTVIAVSQRIRADLRQHYGRADGVRVIYHGVDCETFHPRNKDPWRAEIRRQIGLSEEACVALYVGDMQKAGMAAIRAIARAPQVQLVAVSRSAPGPYRALSQEVGAADRVHLLPGTQQVERYYASADMFVFPTFYDSFGLVVTEAMASGLPVVCSQAAGVAELIEDGVNGLLVKDAWAPEPFAAAINRLAADPELRRRLGVAARQTAVQHTWDRVAQETLAVYQEMMP